MPKPIPTWQETGPHYEACDMQEAMQAEIDALRAALQAQQGDVIEQAKREGWESGMQEANSLIAEDDSCNVLANLESDLAALLPGAYYMDQPDGGDVTLIEQIRRMAKDAERYRWLRANHSEYVPASPAESLWGSKRQDYVMKSMGALDTAIDAAMLAARREG